MEIQLHFSLTCIKLKIWIEIDYQFINEAVVAHHMQLPVAAFSVVTDLCDPDNLMPASITSILHHAEKGGENLRKLLVEMLKML